MKIVYPEIKNISDEKIEMLFADAVANMTIGFEYLGAKTVMEKARALDDAGIITLGKED